MCLFHKDSDNMKDESLTASCSTYSSSFISCWSQTLCDVVESDPRPVTPAGCPPPRFRQNSLWQCHSIISAIILQMEFWTAILFNLSADESECLSLLECVDPVLNSLRVYVSRVTSLTNVNALSMACPKEMKQMFVSVNTDLKGLFLQRLWHFVVSCLCSAFRSEPINMLYKWGLNTCCGIIL